MSWTVDAEDFVVLDVRGTIVRWVGYHEELGTMLDCAEVLGLESEIAVAEWVARGTLRAPGPVLDGVSYFQSLAASQGVFPSQRALNVAAQLYASRLVQPAISLQRFRSLLFRLLRRDVFRLAIAECLPPFSEFWNCSNLVSEFSASLFSYEAGLSFRSKAIFESRSLQALIDCGNTLFLSEDDRMLEAAAAAGIAKVRPFHDLLSRLA